MRRYQQRHVRLSQVERLQQRLCLALLGVVPRTIEAEHSGGLAADSGDIDADGDADIVAAPRWGPIYWYDNLDQGANFVRRVVATVSQGLVVGLRIGDLDGDADMDIIGMINGGLKWFQNLDSRGGQFQEHDITSERTSALAVADMDSDGDLDLVGWVDNWVGWYPNEDGRGSFGLFQPFQVLDGRIDSFLSTADLDADGDVDIVVHSGNDRYLGWYENQGPGTELVRHDLSDRSILSDQPPVIVDIDRDNDLDILFDSSVYRNGPLGFQSERVITGAIRIAGVADLDNDGDLDLVTRTNSSVRWRENTGSVYSDRQELFELSFDDQITMADLDGTGRGNILLNLVLENRLLWLDVRIPGDANGDGFFDSTDLLAVLQAGEYEDSISGNSTFAEGDWNGDDDFTTADLVFAMQAGHYVQFPLAESLARAVAPSDLLARKRQAVRVNPAPYMTSTPFLSTLSSPNVPPATTSRPTWKE